MSRFKLGAAMALLIAASTPAFAQGDGSLACVTETTAPTVAASIGQSLYDETTGKGSGIGDTDSNRLAEIAAHCAETNNWSSDQLNAAITWAIAQFGIAATEPVLRSMRIEPRALVEVYGGLTREQRSGLAQDPADQAAVEALVNGALARDLPVATDNQAMHVGMYAAFLALRENSREAFAAPVTGESDGQK